MLTRKDRLCFVALWAIAILPAAAQVNDAGAPIIFNNGNTVNTSTLNSLSNTGNSDPLVDNPVEVLGSGTLTGGSEVDLIGPFSGTGTLTLNLSDTYQVGFGYGYYDSDLATTYQNAFNFQSGGAEFLYGSSVIDGAVSVTGSFSVAYTATVVLDSNSISGASGTALTGGTIVYAGTGFTFNSATSGGYMANTTGTQTFGGRAAGTVWRLGNGGTSVFTSSISSLEDYGGTVVLQGNGTTGSVYLQGGSLVLDNTSQNNNSRLTGNVIYAGGNLTLMGVNSGTTTQTASAPTFNAGLNVITVQAGTGSGSAAVLSFTGTATGNGGAVDFEGLNSNSQVFLYNQAAGALGAWATVGGSDFATYSTANGVQAMSSSGRPSQVSAGTYGSYVLATGAQNNLTSNVTVTGVTTTSGQSLNLGGNTLSLSGWIQNGGAGSISNGSVSGTGTIYLTTNSNLSISANIVNDPSIAKNGSGTLTLSGAWQYFGSASVNAGTLVLDLTAPLESVQGVPTLYIGDSAGATGSAVVSLQANNQFTTSGGQGDFVNVEVAPAGIFQMNGHNANTGYLEVNGGTIDTGGGMLTTGGVEVNALTAPGLIENGQLQITPNNDPMGTGAGKGGFYVNSDTPLDALDVTSQVISSSSITKSGNGTLVLGNASNSFGDGTVSLIIDAGTVALTSAGAAGSSTEQIQLNGGILRADTSGTLVLDNPISVGGGVITEGSDVVLQGGITQTVYGMGFGETDTLTVNGYTIQGSNYYAVHGGPGTLILTGTGQGTTTGAFTQEAGTLAFGSSNALPTGMSLDYEGGMIEAVNGSQMVSAPLTISEDVTFGGSQALNFNAASGNNINGGMVTRYFYMTGTGPVTINNLTNSESDTLAVAGTGTLVLSGDPSGFVGTTITGATLRFQNTDATGASLGAVHVYSGGTLGRTGSSGAVTVASGGDLDPGSAPDATGTMILKSGLTLSSGADLTLDLGKSASDEIEVTGGLFSAPSSGGPVELTLRDAGDFGAGTYTLMTWTGASSAVASDFSIEQAISGYTYRLSVSNDALDLTATAIVPEPGTWALLLGGLGLLVVWRRRRVAAS